MGKLTKTNFTGYIILPPLNPWEEKDKALIYRDMAMGTFARSPELSWRKFIGYDVEQKEVAIKIQRYHDKGYRITKVSVEVES